MAKKKKLHDQLLDEAYECIEEHNNSDYMRTMAFMLWCVMEGLTWLRSLVSITLGIVIAMWLKTIM